MTAAALASLSMDRYKAASTVQAAHSPRPVFLGKPGAGRRADGAELGIFAAERYFGAGEERCHAVPTPPGDSFVSCAVDASSQSGRTAVSSEASWNSRTGLLSNQSAGKPRGGAARDHGGKKAASGHQRWGLFGRDCPCAGKKSVSVDAVEPKTPSIREISPNLEYYNSILDDKPTILAKEVPPSVLDKEVAMEQIAKLRITPGNRTKSGVGTFPTNSNAFAPSKIPSFAAFPPEIGRRVSHSGGFSFPVLSPASVAAVDEPPRESLEVFRPIDEDTVVHSEPPLVANCARRGFPRVVAVDEETMSDASSDLFELESFAASSSYLTTHRRSRANSLDEVHAAAEPALSECMYPPSEASVVWSVATADGGAFDAASVANFSSAASACYADDPRFFPEKHDRFAAAVARSAAGRKKGAAGNGGGFLNSCRCEKAVSVGPSPVRVDTDQKHRHAPPLPAAEPEAVKPSGVVSLSNNGKVVARVHMPVRT